MDPPIIASDAVQDEAFLPRQIFVFGHLEQIKSYAPGHQVRFGNLNYTADARDDLIFDRFEPMPDAPRSHDEQDVTLPPDSVREIASTATPPINP